MHSEAEIEECQKHFLENTDGYYGSAYTVYGTIRPSKNTILVAIPI